MKKLQIESLGELETMFREKTIEMTDNIKDSIQEAVTTKKRVAQLFEIQMEGVEGSFEISLPKKEWIIALENCLRHYEEWEHSDDAIDTFLLIKKLKDE